MDTKEAPKIALGSIGSLFGETWKLYKERWSVLVEIVLLPTLVVMLGTVIIGLDLGSLFRVIGALIIFIGWIIFVYCVLPVIYSIHNTTGVDASYKATIGGFWPYVWVVILELLAVMGASVMLIIPGIWLGIALSFAGYVFVIEHRHGIDALRQSKDYIKGYWWAVLGRTLLLGIIYLAAVMIIRTLFVAMGGQVLGGLASALMVLFFVPFSAIYQYLIFKNLRELKPALAEAHMKEGMGFIKTSAVVGIVALILLVILAVLLAGLGVFYMMRHANLQYSPSPGYTVQVSPPQQ
jgi:hypothetical protein